MPKLFLPHFSLEFSPHSTSKMIKKFLESLEDPQMSLFGPNFWILKKFGLILPKSSIGKVICITIHILATLFVMTQYIDVLVTNSDLDQVLTNLKISMVSIICVSKSNSFVLWQEKWRQVIEYLTLADSSDRQSNDPEQQKIIAGYTKYSRRITYLFWALNLSTMLTIITAPAMKYGSSVSLREGMRNGTEGFPHIFFSWVPFDKEHSPGCWVTMAWHTFICIYGAGVITAYDTSIIVIMVFFGGKLDLLRIQCKQMFGIQGKRVSHAESWETTRYLQQIHVQMTRHSELFNSLLSPIMFIYMVMCSFVLCASAFQVTSDISATQKIITAQYFVFVMAQLFLYCWHSNEVFFKSADVSMGPYESKWWSAGVRQKRKVLLLAGQLRKEHVYTAGPFTRLTLATFISIVRGAYSFYTLLQKK